MYIPYATSYHEKTGDIINFTQFEEGGLLENKLNLVEDRSISVSIYESSAADNSAYEYLSTGALKDIWDGSYLHPNINARGVILKIHDHIRQAISEWK